MKIPDAFEELENVLSKRSKDGLHTAVPLLGNGINIQAAICANLPIADDWHQTLLIIADELSIGPSQFNQLPFTGPLLWDVLVRKKASASNFSLHEADIALRKILSKRLKELEQKTKSLQFYGNILSASFENIVSLNIDQRLALHAESSEFVSQTDEFGTEAFS